MRPPYATSHEPLGAGRANLIRQEGSALYSAAEALLKGILEADLAVELVTGPTVPPLGGVLALVADDGVGSLLALHGTSFRPAPDAGRAATLARYAAQSGRRAVALIPNAQLDLAMPALQRIRGAELPTGGAMIAVMEDDPAGSPASCPRQAALRLDWPMLEPSGVAQLRDAVPHAVRLGRAGRRPVAVVCAREILLEADTLEARPNRVPEGRVTATARPGRRRARWAETEGVLRMARKLELNLAESVPNPGERVPVGFLVVGPAAAALFHVVHVLSMYGRVPVVQLGLLNPLDAPAVERLLGRCQQVILLEPRPGTMEAGVLAVAEAMRRRDEKPAPVWCRVMPPDAAGASQALEPLDAMHPSILARRIIHLLHLIRPMLDVSASLSPRPPALPVSPPPPLAGLGDEGVVAHLRGVLADVDQWLRDHPPEAEAGAGAPVVTSLAVDGVEPPGPVGRLVRAETWTQGRFMAEGIPALRQAAWDESPWIFVIGVAGARAQDVERLARGAVPGERADRVRLETADLNDRGALRELLQELAQQPGAGLAIVVAADGPPPRYDVAALERALAEIDGLGYQPRQRVIWSLEDGCAVRPVAGPGPPAARTPGESIPARLENRLTTGRATPRLRGQVRLRVRPFLEQDDVARERPPAPPRRRAAAAPGRPEPRHAQASQWRVHLAGWRGEAPGVVARVLADAGRRMGYHVRLRHDPQPLGPGRRAWTQVLFTRPRREQEPPPITARIPYGEADLLLGLDAGEALRAIDPALALRVAATDRTAIVVNSGAFIDDHEPAELPTGPIAAALRAVCRDDVTPLLEDFSGACRAAFQTDRVADLVILGTAFQMGLVPLTPEALDAGVRAVEAAGAGRAVEAFQFGRQLAADPRLFQRPRDPEAEAVERSVRRGALLARRGRGRRGDDARRVAELVAATMSEAPGLSETDPGRQARRDLVAALERLTIWGGPEYAERYAELVMALYRADRGDRGRALTRDAVLPLAEAMLIRDPIYVATVATGRLQRWRVRRRLNVKRARGDRISRRFLVRVELVAARRRMRLDVRTSDWPLQLLAILRLLVPRRFRGTRRERLIRASVSELVRRAAAGAADDYDRWAEAMRRLHQQALEDRLRGMAPSELEMLIGETKKTNLV